MGVRRVTAVGLIAASAALVGVAPASPAVALPEVQECVAQPTLQPGSTGPGVFCLQYTLIMAGFAVPYTGVYDGVTEAAVRWYQSTTPPLVADGRAGDDTLRALGIHASAAVWADPVTTATTLPEVPTIAAPAGAAVGSRQVRQACVADAEIRADQRGQSVACLQRRLAELGFYQGSITGLHDGASQEALRRYQRATPPLRVDGIGGPRTLAALDIWSGLTSGTAGRTGPGPFPAPVQNEPQWNLTAEGIPYYGNRKACTPAEAAVIAAEFAHDGADAATQQWAVYIASREGGCRPDAVNVNPRTKDDSHCTFQLNALSGHFEPRAPLGRRGWTVESVKSSLQACADAASDLWVYCGRGPWEPPYSCRPPWAGATVGQPPAALPPPTAPPVPDTTLPPAAPPDTAPPATDPPASAPVDTTIPS